MSSRFKTVMSTYNIKNIIFIFNLIGLLLSSAIITGVVSDSDTGAPLIGANVFIDGTEQGSATDVSGAYLISNVRACSTCTYELKVLYIGYREYSKKIRIDTDREYTYNLSIDPSSLEVETTTITANPQANGVPMKLIILKVLSSLVR